MSIHLSISQNECLKMFTYFYDMYVVRDSEDIVVKLSSRFLWNCINFKKM